MRVLVVEDTRSLAEVVAEGLRDQGMAVDVAHDGLAAAARLDLNSYDVVVLDRDLPGIHGDTLCQMITERDDRAMVLMLTAAGSPGDRVSGLTLGADDYLAKPFDLAELEARVRALTRRGMAGSPTLLHHGALKYDQIGRSASLNGAPLDLSARELSLLEVFLQRAGRLVSKDQLVSHLCEWGEEVSPNAIEVYVHRLRKKLEPGGVRIVTVRGIGYSLEKPL